MIEAKPKRLKVRQNGGGRGGSGGGFITNDIPPPGGSNFSTFYGGDARRIFGKSISHFKPPHRGGGVGGGVER